MGWIRKSHGSGLQAVHAVGGEEIARRYFGYQQYGREPERVEQIARRWLRWCMYLRPTANVANKPQENKRQDYPRGVSHRFHKRSKTHEVRVSWHDGNRRRTKTFYIGTEDAMTDAEFRVAERAAIAFRQEYLRCRCAGVVFDDSAFNDWRERYT